jgi:toxin ParE1/3/4
VKEVDLSPRAQEDVLDITNYTLHTWGEEQMNRYVDGLNLKFLDLAEAPRHFPRRNDAGRGMRSARYGAHVIFFRITGTGIRVIRVLHHKQDYKRHLRIEDGSG